MYSIAQRSGRRQRAAVALACCCLLAGAAANSENDHVKKNGEDGPKLVPNPKLRKSRAGAVACQTDREIPNWDNTLVPVCNETICTGASRLGQMATVDDQSVRFTKTQLENYLLALEDKEKISGWMDPVHAYIVGLISHWQHSNGLFGSVGEVGVFQGKLFLSLAGFSSPHEPLMAADWFDFYEVRGYLKGFQRNIHTFLGMSDADINIYQGNSFNLTPSYMVDKQMPLFRLLSVDAGHDMDEFLHDIMLAACVVADGGIVIADDFEFLSWMGINTAVYNFAVEQDRLVPFLHSHNKLYFTTISHQEMYFRLMEKADGVTCYDKDTMNPATYSIANYKICMYNGRDSMVTAHQVLQRLEEGFLKTSFNV